MSKNYELVKRIAVIGGKAGPAFSTDSWAGG